ncbi:MAG: AsmA family protein [Bdellovibrionota bacterium]|nr:AsmA family protein [Bdellovibrionota bacterium]
MKKLVVALIVFFAVVFGGLVSFPFFYDIDKKVRPEIERLAKESINGKLEVGKLSLSLLGGVYIDIQGIKLSSEKETIVSTDRAQVSIPFIEILKGGFSGSLELTGPNINISKNKKGEFNFASLVKKQAEVAEAATGESAEEKSEGAKLGILDRVDIDLIIKNAKVNYSDLQSGFNTNVNNFSLSLENLGFSKEIDLKIKTDLNLRPNSDISLNGDVEILGKSYVEWGDTSFSDVSLDLEVDLTGLDAQVAGLLSKGKSVPLKLELQSKLYQNNLQLEALNLVVNDFKISTNGTVKSFEPLKYEFVISSNSLELSNWRKILRPVGQFGVTGALDLNLKVKGDTDNLDYNGAINFRNGRASIPGIRSPFEAILAKIELKTDQLRIEEIQFNAGTSTVSLNGELKGFDAPRVKLGVYSKGINSADFIAPMTEAEKQQKIEEAKAEQPALTEEQIQQMLMGPIEQLKQVPILKKTILDANLKIDKLTHERIKASNLVTDLHYKDLKLNLKRMSFDVFGGKAAVVSMVNIKPKKPTYEMKARVAGLDVVEATDAFVPDLKGSLTGLLEADFQLSGIGASEADVREHLEGKGGFNLKEGTWSGLQAMKIVGEKLSSINGAKDKASQVKIGNEFKEFKGNFVISKSVFTLTNFNMDLKEARTAVVGKGTVNFDLNANMIASIIAPLKNPPPKIRYSDGRAELPIEITGPVSSPKIDWQKMLNKVAGAYAERAGKKAIAKEKKKVEKKIEQEAKKLLKSDDAKKLLKGLGF